MNGAAALIAMLSACGVEMARGGPGDTGVALGQALRGIENVPCRGARAAVPMADRLPSAHTWPLTNASRGSEAATAVCVE